MEGPGVTTYQLLIKQFMNYFQPGTDEGEFLSHVDLKQIMEGIKLEDGVLIEQMFEYGFKMQMEVDQFGTPVGLKWWVLRVK